MMSDPVFTIREESTSSIIALSEALFDKQWLYNIIETKLSELSKHERFMLRIQSIHLLNRMAEHVEDDFLNQMVTDFLFALAEDPVPNIRFNSAKTIQ